MNLLSLLLEVSGVRRFVVLLVVNDSLLAVLGDLVDDALLLFAVEQVVFGGREPEQVDAVRVLEVVGLGGVNLRVLPAGEAPAIGHELRVSEDLVAAFKTSLLVHLVPIYLSLSHNTLLFA